DWSNAKLGMLDLQWADLRQDKGLYHTLVARGAMRTIVNNEQIQHAINFPLTTPRAWARARLMAGLGALLADVSWETVVVRPFRTGPIHRFHFAEPLSATSDALHGLLDPELPQISLDDTSANHAELALLLKQVRPDRAIGHR